MGNDGTVWEVPGLDALGHPTFFSTATEAAEHCRDTLFDECYPVTLYKRRVFPGLKHAARVAACLNRSGWEDPRHPAEEYVLARPDSRMPQRVCRNFEEVAS